MLLYDFLSNPNRFVQLNNTNTEIVNYIINKSNKYFVQLSDNKKNKINDIFGQVTHLKKSNI